MTQYLIVAESGWSCPPDLSVPTVFKTVPARLSGSLSGNVWRRAAASNRAPVKVPTSFQLVWGADPSALLKAGRGWRHRTADACAPLRISSAFGEPTPASSKKEVIRRSRVRDACSVAHHFFDHSLGISRSARPPLDRKCTSPYLGWPAFSDPGSCPSFLNSGADLGNRTQSSPHYQCGAVPSCSTGMKWCFQQESNLRLVITNDLLCHLTMEALYLYLLLHSERLCNKI